MSVLPLKAMPDDVKSYLLKLQGEKKEKKLCGQYSLEKVIYDIIRADMKRNNYTFTG